MYTKATAQKNVIKWGDYMKVTVYDVVSLANRLHHHEKFLARYLAQEEIEQSAYDMLYDLFEDVTRSKNILTAIIGKVENSN